MAIVRQGSDVDMLQGTTEDELEGAMRVLRDVRRVRPEPRP